MARGDGRIYLPKNSSVWHAAYCVRGKEVRETTGQTDRKQALKFLKRRRDELGAERIGKHIFLGAQAERVTVNEILDLLVSNYMRGGKRGIERQVNPQMESHLNRVRKFFGDMRAVEVGTITLDRFVKELKAQRKANATINRSLQLLSQAFKVAKACDPPILHRELTIHLLDESDNVRKGKFSFEEAQAIFAALPTYMAHVAMYAYETGTRSAEIRKLKWSYLGAKAFSVPSLDAKNRKARTVALDPLAEIIALRRKARIPGCDLVFHNEGHAIGDYRKCWHTAAVLTGVAHFYCRTCRDEEGRYISVLDAKKICSKCGAKWTKKEPKYIGKNLHDFRRSCSYEMYKSGSSIEDCMEVTGHRTRSMFLRYADLFSDEERQQKQIQVQDRRREWRERESQASVAMVQ